MKWTVLIASLIAAFSSYSTTPVLANDVSDVVRARANARAGGGTSGHDAWVLKRHGKLSGSGNSSRRSLVKKKAAKKRAYLLAKKKKAAAAKHRAYLAAKKKKAAQRRAYLLAKKKAKQKRAIALAQKKKEAAKRARIAAKKNAKTQQLAAVTQDTVESDKKESAFVATPSTATVMTSLDRAQETADVTPARSTTADVAVVETNPATLATKELVTTDQNVGSKDENPDETCQRFLPAIGLTISVGC